MKFVPVIVTVDPTGPLIGLTLVIVGGVLVTLNFGWYMATPLVEPTRHRPFGGVPAGTLAVICVGETIVNVVGLSKNETRFGAREVRTGNRHGRAHRSAHRAHARDQGRAFVTVKSELCTASPSAVRTRQRPGDGVPLGTFAVICVAETTV